MFVGESSWRLAASNWQEREQEARQDTTRFEVEKRQKRGVDRAVTARSNWGLVFVCNKSAMGGWGLAEGTQAEGRGKSGDRDIGKSGDRNPKGRKTSPLIHTD